MSRQEWRLFFSAQKINLRAVFYPVYSSTLLHESPDCRANGRAIIFGICATGSSPPWFCCLAWFVLLMRARSMLFKPPICYRQIPEPRLMSLVRRRLARDSFMRALTAASLHRTAWQTVNWMWNGGVVSTHFPISPSHRFRNRRRC